MKTFIILVFLLFLTTVSAAADIVVIGNLDTDISSLSSKQVQEIFLGRTRVFSDGSRVFPLDVSDLRVEFYQKLTHRPIEQIDGYWARLQFSGRSSPPELKKDQQAVVAAVKENRGVVAYIERKIVDETQVKILFSVK